METPAGMMTGASHRTGLLHSLRRAGATWCAIAVACCAMAPLGAVDAAGKASTELASNAAPSTSNIGPLLTLGIGDAVSVQVYGRPELSITTYVSDDGTIPVPLAGNVPVAGLSPAKAGQSVAAAFRQGKFLVDPQVNVLLVQFRGQQVSVLGAVRTPGRFPVESKSTVLDVLAQAGGTTENSADVVVLLRADKGGTVTRTSIDLRGLTRGDMPVPTLALRGGDSLFVPAADQFFINGEVRSPSVYRLDPGMTVLQAIARSGGITRGGSSSRIEIKRRSADGKYVTRDGELGDAVQANDVIRVKERLF